MLKSERCHTGSPLIVRFSNCLSSEIVRTTEEILSRASTKRNSRGGEFSAVVNARVTRLVSAGDFNPGGWGGGAGGPGPPFGPKTLFLPFFCETFRSKNTRLSWRMWV